MEILTPKTVDVLITGMDSRNYLCKLTTTGQQTVVHIDPLANTNTGVLDLNDKEYLEFYLTTKVNEFIDRYTDRDMQHKVKHLKALLEGTYITNHFDYLTFSKKALKIVESMEKQTNAK
jgi:hypothetical protein